MLFLTILLVILSLFALVSIILAIINWVLLASSALKVTHLEAEIDKKTREFDAIKKEWHTSVQERAQIIAGASGNESDATNAHEHDYKPDIEIVRNVRASDSAILTNETSSASHDSMGHYESHRMNESMEYSQGPAQTPIGQSPFSNAQVTPTQPSGSDTGEYPGTQFGNQFLNQPLSQEPLEVYNERGISPVTPPVAPTPVHVPVYSQITHDADYHNAWQMISDSLQKIPQPYFQIDFTGVDHINEPEIGYLMHFTSTVAQYGGYIAFVNCTPSMAAILMSNSTLAPFILR